MKFTIKHESRGRMRVHMEQYRMTYEQSQECYLCKGL